MKPGCTCLSHKEGLIIRNGNEKKKTAMYCQDNHISKKMLYAIFFNASGPVVHVSCPSGHTVTGWFYKNSVLKKVKEFYNKKLPSKGLIKRSTEVIRTQWQNFLQEPCIWPFYGKVKFSSVCICMSPIHLYGKNVDNFKWPPLKPLGQYCSNFMWSLLGAGEWKIAKMVMVHWPKWLPCSYMEKTFKNLLLQNQISPGA